jgi:hypothetical protein
MAVEKQTAIALLIGGFIAFILVFVLLVGCCVCIIRFRPNDEDETSICALQRTHDTGTDDDENFINESGKPRAAQEHMEMKTFCGQSSLNGEAGGVDIV